VNLKTAVESYSSAISHSVLEPSIPSASGPGNGLNVIPVDVAADVDTAVMPAPRRFDSPAWKVFGTTFVTIFLAELGDKTQVSTLLMSAESHQPWTIFAGAATALISTSLLGVLVGCWLAARISPQVLDRAAGITLAILSVWLFWEVLG
jgi:putative Ca2+/H+ antiporter (TMEM165/GDT1 family)